MFDWVLLIAAGFAAGVLNAIAGGGSFLTFPALVFTGVGPIAANATSAVAVSPGYLGSALGFGRELATLSRRRLIREAAVCAVGGIAGALLLLVTPSHVFAVVVPWLLLFATVLFALGPRLLSARAAQARRVGGMVQTHPAVQLVGLLAVALYGGYFNGGLGILLMALYTLSGETDLNIANALKNLNSLVLSVLSVVAFALAGAIQWPQAVLMMLGASAGGVAGAWLARRLPARWVRMLVVVTGLAMAAVFFTRA